jgi:hypothetical protein
MRPPTFDAQTLRTYLRRHRIADLPALKQALGTRADLTVFRKLTPLGYLSSYSHRGRFYTLRSIARFTEDGLWSHQGVWFSRQGTLMATLEAWITRSADGWFADELTDRLHVQVQDPLRDLVRQGRVRRSDVADRFLYTVAASRRAKAQIRARRTADAVPLVADATTLAVSPDELKAAILLFYSLLDEQQRRLFAGLESIKLGRGGDTILATFLNLDPHTVARGRQHLLDHDVAPGRTRRVGAGRTPVEKNPPRSSP